ncbi:hypothetical protein PoB_007204500 [Plakobranchus ocellatus]|uniref:Uncharacterized protein n=1 Tax=Plakobranchus ocellatus TaxID=259542 RepID=A0AAV4DND4_9GAST|nr:hypothetical protein PoB_007204500 [Plakobranchus ocellatus]
MQDHILVDWLDTKPKPCIYNESRFSIYCATYPHPQSPYPPSQSSTLVRNGHSKVHSYSPVEAKVQVMLISMPVIIVCEIPIRVFTLSPAVQNTYKTELIKLVKDSTLHIII